MENTLRKYHLVSEVPKSTKYYCENCLPYLLPIKSICGVSIFCINYHVVLKLKWSSQIRFIHCGGWGCSFLVFEEDIFLLLFRLQMIFLQ